MSDGRVVIETSLDNKKLNKELKGLDKQIQAKSSGITKSFDKVGTSLTNKITKPAGIAAGAVAGIVLAKGWARMTEIDNAKAKLRGVGNSAKDVAKIMDNATEAVKGTAYGLDAAATASASAVAAGIKPGKELTQYLTNMGDAAAIAGVDLDQMGRILNQIQTAGVAYTGDLNQLADRGLPVYQWLGEAAGKSAAEMRKAASSGQVSAQMVQDAIQNNIGGAAKEIGSTTITGAISNIGASICRIGANFLGSADDAKSFSGMILPMLNNFMDSLGDVEDKAKSWGGTFASVIKGTIGYFKQGSSAINKTNGSAKKVLNTIKPVLAITKKLATSFGDLGTDTKVKFVGALVLAGPALKLVSKGMRAGYTGAMAYSKGINAVTRALGVNTTASKVNATQTKTTGIAAKISSTYNKAYSTSIAASTTKLGVNTVATRTSAVASGTAAVATKGLSAAMAFMGGPVGVAITAIAGLLAVTALIPSKSSAATIAVQKEKEAVKELTQNYRENKKSREDAYTDAVAEAGVMEHLGGQIESLSKKENKSATEKARLKTYVDQLNDAAGETVVKYDEQTDSLSKTTDEIWNYINASKEQVIAEAARAQASETAKNLIKNEQELTKAKDTQKTAQNEYNKALENYNKLSADAKAQGGSKEAQLLGQAKANLNDADTAVNDLNKTIKTNQEELDSYMGKATAALSMESVTKSLDELVKKGANKGKAVPEALAQGIAEGSYLLPESVDQLNQLINFDEKLNSEEFKALGIKIPADIQAGINEGSAAGYQTASTWIDGILNNDALITKARESGTKVPQGLASGIREGQYGIVSSVNQVASLVKFDSLEKKAGNTKVMDVWKKRLQDGKAKPAEAVKEAEALITFNKAYKNASAAGKKTMDSWAKKMEEGKMKPSTAAKGASELIAKEADKTPKAVDKSASKVKKSTNKMVTGAKPKNVRSTFKPIGSQITSGTASGVTSGPLNAAIRKMIKDGLAAGKDEAQIKSPSRLFKKQVGVNIAKGAAAGIASGTKYTKAAMKNLVKSTAKSVKNVKSNFTGFGTTTVKNVTNLIKAGQKKAESSFSKYLSNRLKAVKKSNKAEYNAVKTANAKALAAYKSAYTKQANALISKTNTNITKISDKYQAAYDKLIARRDALKENLMNIDLGNDFSVTGLKDMNAGSLTGALKKNNKDLEKYITNLDSIRGKVSDEMYAEILKMDVSEANKHIKKLQRLEGDALDQYVAEYTATQKKIQDITTQQYKNTLIDDLEANNKALAQYAVNMNKHKGKIPESMLEEILGMDTATANAYMEALNAMSDAEYKNYIAMWKQKENYAASISNNLVSGDIAKLRKDYQAAMNKEMKSLQTAMNKLGKNVAAGFTKGLASQKASMSSTIKAICNQVIKDTKKKFGIKSPSRVMAKIFRQVVQGGEVGTVKEAPKLIKTADKVSDSFVDRFERANIDPTVTVARMRQSVIAEQSRQPASVIRYVNKLEDSAQNNRVLHITLDEADVIIDGKVAGKTLSRHIDVELAKIQRDNAR